MTTQSRFLLSVAAASLCVGLAVVPAAFAQTMSKEGAAMSNPGGDKMAKPDAMGKTDSMAKPANTTDAMQKTDAMSDKKKDAMSGGMTK